MRALLVFTLLAAFAAPVEAQRPYLDLAELHRVRAIEPETTAVRGVWETGLGVSIAAWAITTSGLWGIEGTRWLFGAEDTAGHTLASSLPLAGPIYAMLAFDAGDTATALLVTSALLQIGGLVVMCVGMGVREPADEAPGPKLSVERGGLAIRW